MTAASREADAIVVGSGPNGLSGALTLARAGLKVRVIEGSDTPGGGCRTEELTLPGYLHDVCSAVHPLLTVSPFFRNVDLERRSVRLRKPKVAFAHPLDGGRAVAVVESVHETAAGLGRDGNKYEKLLGPFVRDADKLLPTVLSPMRSVPAHPLAMARFGVEGVTSAKLLARRFESREARALVAGAAAHSMRPLSAPLTGSFGILFSMIAHVTGWPLVQGGSARVVDALVEEIESLGGTVETGSWVKRIDDLPPARTVLMDVTPRQLLEIGGERIRGRRRRSLERFRYGPGVCKVDWALAGPVPWAAPACREAGTVHLGGTFEEVAASESDVAAGRHPDKPYCLVAQPGIVDESRAPSGRQTLWAYCHVPPGSTLDMTERIEAQIERFAPGFKDLVLERRTTTAAQTEDHNPNYVGGDINGGAATVRQTFFRPTASWNPYRTAIDGVYICSSSTPPGGGVHGMCGYWAAVTALKDLGIGARH